MSRTKASFCVITATIVTVMALFFSPYPKPAMFHTAPVVCAPLEEICMLQGTAINADTRYLVAPCAGLVENVYVSVGDSVAQQELLLKLDAATEQERLAQLQNQRYQVEACFEAFGSSLLPKVAGYALNWDLGSEELLCLIEAKQIRAAANGVVSNLYVRPGQYVAQGALLGETCGDGVCITALWSGDRMQAPKPGMQAWWCSDDGMKLGKLMLDSVNIISEAPQLSMQLCFRTVAGEPMPDIGDQVPVRLILEHSPNTAQIPLEAIAEDGSLWLVRDGRLCRETVAYGKSNDECIQVPDSLIGLQVVLKPDTSFCTEGGRVKDAEVT